MDLQAIHRVRDRLVSRRSGHQPDPGFSVGTRHGVRAKASQAQGRDGGHSGEWRQRLSVHLTENGLPRIIERGAHLSELLDAPLPTRKGRTTGHRELQEALIHLRSQRRHALAFHPRCALRPTGPCCDVSTIRHEKRRSVLTMDKQFLIFAQNLDDFGSPFKSKGVFT